MPDFMTTLQERIYDWYWNFGIQRNDVRWALQQNELFDIYDKAGQYEILKTRIASKRKPTIALWGLSQGGKSMLLQRGLDLPKPATNGFLSALQWNRADPVTFIHNDTHGNVSLNPNEVGLDATACITRFTLRDGVSDPLHSVEITLLDKLSLLKTLAVGYAASLPEPDDDSSEQCLAEEEIARILHNGGMRCVDKTSFLDLMDFIAVLQVAKEHKARYRNITDNSVNALKSCRQIPNDMDGVFSEVFWNNESSITKLYNKAREFIDRYRGKRIYCSYTVVRILINMQTYAKTRKGGVFDDDVVAETLRKISRITVEDKEGVLNIDLAPEGGEVRHPLGNEEDFVTFQSLIREIIIPVNKIMMQDNAAVTDMSALCSLLDGNDLLDFPGVTWLESDAKAKAAAGTFTSDNVHSGIVKLGKTLSAASISAFENVDDFCVMINIGTHRGADKAATGILSRSVESWRRSRGKGRTLSVLTFLGDLLERINSKGENRKESISYFTPLDRFGILFNVEETDMRFVHYVISEATKKKSAMLKSFAAYLDAPGVIDQLHKKFGKDAAGLDRIIRKMANGKTAAVDGRAGLLKWLATRLDSAQNDREINIRMDRLRKEILEKLERLSPDKDAQENANEYRETNSRLADAVVRAINEIKQKRGKAEEIRKICATIIRFTKVDVSSNGSDSLALDISVLEDRASLRSYRDCIPMRLAEKARVEYASWFFNDLGLDGASDFGQQDEGLFIDRFYDVLSFKNIAVDSKSPLQRIGNAVGYQYEQRLKNANAKLNQNAICETVRSYFAIKLEDNLSGRELAGPRPADKDPPESGEYTLDAVDDPALSPYHVIIENFKRRVLAIKELRTSDRFPQVGDGEIATIIFSMKGAENAQ
jgi:hypothetical protein